MKKRVMKITELQV